MVVRLVCPQCSSVNEFEPGAAKSCVECGYGSPADLPEDLSVGLNAEARPAAYGVGLGAKTTALTHEEELLAVLGQREIQNSWLTSRRYEVTLTTKRLHVHARSFGQRAQSMIDLRSIHSVHVAKRLDVVAFALGTLLVFGGLSMFLVTATVGLVIGLPLVAIGIITWAVWGRRLAFSVGAGDDTFAVPIRSRHRDSMDAFAEQVLDAKDAKFVR